MPAVGGQGPAPENDVAILAAWQRHQILCRDRRALRQQIAQVRFELGSLLAQKRAALARPGAGGKFHAWLRAHQIPRTTAYRLIEPQQKRVNRLSSTKEGTSVVPLGTINPSPRPVFLQLIGTQLVIHLELSPKQTVVCHAVLEDFNRARIHPATVCQPILTALSNLCGGAAQQRLGASGTQAAASISGMPGAAGQGPAPSNSAPEHIKALLLRPEASFTQAEAQLHRPIGLFPRASAPLGVAFPASRSA